MIIDGVKLDWNDITIVPETISFISSRSEINPFYNGELVSEDRLPLFASPMDTVVDEKNYTKFIDLGINVCLPRHIKYQNLGDDRVFYSYGLDEIISILDNNEELPKKALIDIANGHMLKLLETSKRIKKDRDVELMVGNIANPDTYRKYCEIGVDHIRLNIGSGSACTTAANVGIFYPSASLVNECYNISKEFENPTKIIVDGGFRNTSEIIKALALGGSSVMLGGIFNKCLESCSNDFIKIIPKSGPSEYKEITRDQALKYFNEGGDVYKYYRGMSTKEVQKSWNKKELKTGEGISKYNKVEYTLEGWTENFIDYLKSAMSYTNSRCLEEFIGEVNWVKISQNSFMRFNK
jgi:IMP dehydrogenase/GMP reductase